MKLEFKHLNEIDCSEYIALNTNPLVMRQMPLSDSNFDDAACKEWIAGKEKMWEEHGFGPWAFIVDGKFVGWGGLQPENGEADLALVLHPDYWGTGKVIYQEVIRRAFEEMGFESVTILFPPTRTRVKGILRLGFQPDGEVEIFGERFIRYRLHAPTNKGSE
jgi:[ribosomal protein S5]-alanine N-acetyltransferase